jgi:hypothetical protein
VIESWLHEAVCRQKPEVWVNVGYIKLFLDRDLSCVTVDHIKLCLDSDVS